MMDFEERKAEIFRRSEKRIAQRKRRRRMILCCVSFVICVGSVSFFRFPVSEYQEDNAVYENHDRTAAVSYTCARIQGLGADSEYVKVIEDPERAEKIACVLGSIIEGAHVTAKDDSENKEIAAGVPQKGNESVKDSGEIGGSYQIIINSSDGSEKVYTIYDKCLGTSGVDIQLTDSQLSEIASLLTDTQ